MTARVVYLARRDRGVRVAQARYLSGELDEWWTPPATEGGEPGDLASAVQDEASALASWIAGRLEEDHGRRDSLELLCTDVDGGLCAWLHSPSAEPSVVEAEARRLAEPIDPEEGVLTGGSVVLGPDAATPGGASLQALAEPPASARSGLRLRRAANPADEAGQRLALLSMPDVPVRLMLDELDALGVRGERVLSLWHALAQAWDPATRAKRTLEGDAVEGADDSTTAVVLIDPAGRLIWCWSSAGRLLASGSMRLGLQSGLPRLHEGASSRLIAEWLAWAPQLGRAPDRVVCLASERTAPDGLTPGQFGQSLGEAWPGVGVDFALHDDPIGATLRRLSERLDPEAAPATATDLVGLSNRSGRAHRAMYRWEALAMFVGAAALVLAGVALRSAAGDARAKAAAHASTTETVAREALDSTSILLNPVMQLQREVASARQRLSGPEIEPSLPVLRQLEAIALVIGNGEVELKHLSVSQLNVSMRLSVRDLETYELLLESLNGIEGSSVATWDVSRSEVGQGDGYRIDCTFTGLYR